MKTVCEINLCAGCMACKDICPQNAITINKELEQYNAIINQERCIKCGKCLRVCQQSKTAVLEEPVFWYQGWAVSDEMRSNSTSGGVAQSIESSFIKNGGSVISCLLKDGDFIFEVVSNLDGIGKFVGSKYVKSNPSGIYNQALNLLECGRKVLFVGLPCQAASLRNCIPKKYSENLYIVDLLCHGSPSLGFLEKYLAQYSISLSNIKNIRFRRNTNYVISVENKDIEFFGGSCDHYSTAFLEGISFTKNCYSCQYAQVKRVGDLSIGDYWGANNKKEAQKGISLLLVQNKKGEELVENSNLHIEIADKRKAIAHNQPLRSPINEPAGRTRFFESIKRGKTVNEAVNAQFAWIRFKQFVKGFLIRINIIKRVKK